MGKKGIIVILCCIGLIGIGCNKTFEPEAPAPVMLYEPQTTYASAAKIRWSKAQSENFSAYGLYYDTLPGVSEKSISATTNIFKNDTTFLLSGLKDNTAYYLRVYVYNSVSYSRSNEISFVTEGCTCGKFTNEHEDGMVLLPAGCFVGKDLSIATISHDYFMDTTEVTEREWNNVMSQIELDTTQFTQTEWETILDIDTSTSLKPKIYVSWYQALIYCNEKSKMKGKDTCYTYTRLVIDTIGLRIENMIDLNCEFSRNGYRLPTEDEWEYGYRAGVTTEYFWGKDGNTSMEYPFTATYPATHEDTLEICEYAWWSLNNDPDGPKVVAQKKPNNWHIYDIAGNVEELAWDIYTDYRGMSRIDYSGPEMGPQCSNLRVVRGGYYNDLGKKPTNLTAWWRFSSFFPEMEDDAVGFRCVATAP